MVAERVAQARKLLAPRLERRPQWCQQLALVHVVLGVLAPFVQRLGMHRVRVRRAQALAGAAIALAQAARQIFRGQWWQGLGFQRRAQLVEQATGIRDGITVLGIHWSIQSGGDALPAAIGKAGVERPAQRRGNVLLAPAGDHPGGIAYGAVGSAVALAERFAQQPQGSAQLLAARARAMHVAPAVRAGARQLTGELILELVTQRTNRRHQAIASRAAADYTAELQRLQSVTEVETRDR